ncbi:DUF5658 family protein [Saccharolobus solfataricus]|uniref:DUF5658 family protein n=1 Tax=Saccharolobus solfataricus TaxID=2287 RepID=UPI001F07BADA
MIDQLLIDLIGALGFQINDTLTTYLGVKTGATELNSVFKFLEKGKVTDFILVGIIKILVPIFIYALTQFMPFYNTLLEFDFYFEVAVTVWNTLTIYRHKRGTKW